MPGSAGGWPDVSAGLRQACSHVCSHWLLADISWPWLGQLGILSSVPYVSSPPAGDSRHGLMATEEGLAVRNTQDS